MGDQTIYTDRYRYITWSAYNFTKIKKEVMDVNNVRGTFFIDTNPVSGWTAKSFTSLKVLSN